MPFFWRTACTIVCGYDHMEPEEAALMEEKQECVLQSLSITREQSEKYF